MQSLLYKLIAAVLVVVSLILFVIYMKSAARNMRSKTIDELRDSTSKAGMPDLPDLSQIRETARKHPNSPEAQAALAHALFRTAEYHEALPVFDAAIRLNPADAKLYFERAKIRENTGYRAQAIPDYEQAVALDSKNLPAMLRLAELWRYERDPSRAIQWCRRVLELDPANVAAHRHWGWAHAQNREYSSAINEFEAALRIEPNNDSVLMDLAVAHKNNGDPLNARGTYERACQVNPRNFRACSEARRMRARE